MGGRFQEDLLGFMSSFGDVLRSFREDVESFSLTCGMPVVQLFDIGESSSKEFNSP